MTDTNRLPLADDQRRNDQTSQANLDGIKRKGKTLDRIALWTFIIWETAYFILAAYAIQQLVVDWDEETEFTGQLKEFGDSSGVSMDTNDIKLDPVTGETKTIFVISTLAAFGINALLVLAMRMPSVAGLFVWLGPILFVTGLIVQAVVFASQGIYAPAGVDIGLAVILCGVLYLMRDRFKLAKFTLVSTARIVKRNASILLVTFALMMIQLVLAIINIFATVGVFLRFQPAHQECNEGVYCSATVTVLGCVFTVWAQVWLTSVLSNLVVVTLAGGPFSSHYFFPNASSNSIGDSEKAGQSNDRVGSWEAFGKAFKYSLGATAFGSFLVGLIHLIHDIVANLISSGGESALCLCYCCLLAMGILDSLAQRFKYVFIYVAIGEKHSKKAQKESGKEDRQLIPAFRMTFLEAARHTIHFIVRRPPKKEIYKDGNREHPTEAFMRYIRCHGIAVLINDDLSQSALSLACIASGLISGAIALACVYLFGGAVNDHWYDWAVVLYAFILGLCLGLVFSTAMGVGVSTLFVCMSEDITKLVHLNAEFSEWLRNQPNYRPMFDWLVNKYNGGAVEHDQSYWKTKAEVESGRAMEKR